MEALGLTEKDYIVEDKSSSGLKLVPWISWNDWSFVKESIFSSSLDSIVSALGRVSAWRSRGSLPKVVDVTVWLIEIQQNDPYYRDDISHGLLNSKYRLALQYCMTIIEFVNCVVEKTRKKTEVSIGEAAEAIGIPRMIVDVRHEGSHRELPELEVLRDASTKALDWLKSYYWEPQTKAIRSDQTINIRKETKSVLSELQLALKVEQTTRSSPSTVKEKRSKKQINKLLKSSVRLYSSFSSEVVAILLKLLVKALDSTDLVEIVKSRQVDYFSSSIALDGWKPVIIKLTNKNPELLLTLLKEILHMIEPRGSDKSDFGDENFKYENVREFDQIEQFSYLFEWLVRNCEGLLKLAVETGLSTKENLPNTPLVEYLRKCLLLSSVGNNQLRKSAQILARMTGNSILVERIGKLASLSDLSNLQNKEETFPLISSGSFLSEQEDSLRQAAEKLEALKRQCVKSRGIDVIKTRDGDHNGSESRWVVAKSWKSCPIGMLPSAIGSSGQLPVLDCVDHHEELGMLSGSKEIPVLRKCNGKREAESDTENRDSSSFKRMKESKAVGKEDEGVKGHLMVRGVWKKVGEEEMHAIASAIRILV